MPSVSKLIFGAAIATIGVFAAVVGFEKPAAAQNSTFQQCLATVSGVGGSCRPNPQYQGSPGLYLSTKHSRHHSY